MHGGSSISCHGVRSSARLVPRSSEIKHLLFAITLAAAANAFAEANLSRSDSLATMAVALRWYATTSGVWVIATLWFIVAYAPVTRVGRGFAMAVSGLLILAMLINIFSPASFLYTELTGLRQIAFSLGRAILLTRGEDNPLRLVTELALVAILIVVAEGCYGFWKRKQHTRAALFGIAALGFMVCFETHAFLVDTGRLNSPYLSTFGFLALVGLMSYELAGEVLQKVQLSSELVGKEESGRWQSIYHDAMIDHDKNVGTVLKAVEDAGIADNTFVMYSTDNGPHMNSWPDGAMTPFRNEKNSNWEGATRVPCMVRWPGKIKPGSVSNEIVGHHDWLPTLLAMAGDKKVKQKLLKGYKVGDMT